MATKRRALRDLHTVRATVREVTLAKLKAVALEGAGPGGHSISTNDAFVAWLCNILGTKVFGVMMDSRGKGGVPPGCLGYALSSRFGAPAAGPRRCQALDVRRALLGKEGSGRPGLFKAFSCGADEFMQVNNWVKIQYFPKFGARSIRSITTLGLQRMLESSEKNTQRVLLSLPGEYQMTHWGLSREQAAQVADAWRRLGEHAVSVTSGAEVEDAMQRLGLVARDPGARQGPGRPRNTQGSCCRRKST